MLSDSKWKPQLCKSKVIVKNHYSVLLFHLSLTHTHTLTTHTHFLLCAQASVNLLRRRKWRSQERERERAEILRKPKGGRQTARMEWVKMTFHFRCGVWLHFIIVVAVQFSSVGQKVMSDSLQPRKLQHTRLPCPSFLPEFSQTHVHWLSDANQPSHPLSFPSPPSLNLSQHHGVFPWGSSSHQVAKSFGASALASVLSVDNQGWFPLGLTGLRANPSNQSVLSLGHCTFLTYFHFCLN